VLYSLSFRYYCFHTNFLSLLSYVIGLTLSPNSPLGTQNASTATTTTKSGIWPGSATTTAAQNPSTTTTTTTSGIWWPGSATLTSPSTTTAAQNPSTTTTTTSGIWPGSATGRNKACTGDTLSSTPAAGLLSSPSSIWKPSSLQKGFQVQTPLTAANASTVAKSTVSSSNNNNETLHGTITTTSATGLSSPSGIWISPPTSRTHSSTGGIVSSLCGPATSTGTRTTSLLLSQANNNADDAARTSSRMSWTSETGQCTAPEVTNKKATSLRPSHVSWSSGVANENTVPSNSTVPSSFSSTVVADTTPSSGEVLFASTSEFLDFQPTRTDGIEETKSNDVWHHPSTVGIANSGGSRVAGIDNNIDFSSRVFKQENTVPRRASTFHPIDNPALENVGWKFIDTANCVVTSEIPLAVGKDEPHHALIPVTVSNEESQSADINMASQDLRTLAGSSHSNAMVDSPQDSLFGSMTNDMANADDATTILMNELLQQEEQFSLREQIFFTFGQQEEQFTFGLDAASYDMMTQIDGTIQHNIVADTTVAPSVTTINGFWSRNSTSEFMPPSTNTSMTQQNEEEAAPAPLVFHPPTSFAFMPPTHTSATPHQHEEAASASPMTFLPLTTNFSLPAPTIPFSIPQTTAFSPPPVTTPFSLPPTTPFSLPATTPFSLPPTTPVFHPTLTPTWLPSSAQQQMSFQQPSPPPTTFQDLILPRPPTFRPSTNPKFAAAASTIRPPLLLRPSPIAVNQHLLPPRTPTPTIRGTQTTAGATSTSNRTTSTPTIVRTTPIPIPTSTRTPTPPITTRRTPTPTPMMAATLVHTPPHSFGITLQNDSPVASQTKTPSLSPTMHPPTSPMIATHLPPLQRTPTPTPPHSFGITQQNGTMASQTKTPLPSPTMHPPTSPMIATHLTPQQRTPTPEQQTPTPEQQTPTDTPPRNATNLLLDCPSPRSPTPSSPFWLPDTPPINNRTANATPPIPADEQEPTSDTTILAPEISSRPPTPSDANANPTEVALPLSQRPQSPPFAANIMNATVDVPVPPSPVTNRPIRTVARIVRRQPKTRSNSSDTTMLDEGEVPPVRRSKRLVQATFAKANDDGVSNDNHTLKYIRDYSPVDIQLKKK
jgi:hypothetical protein